ncbi:MAG TPA: methyltransferase, partial [Nitrososphaeraceae archaeon]|nr:methyltransferase [Nitrososphaeraceae archaeon]
DSFFLADCAKEYCGILALEMGAGSGIILNTISQNFNKVVGTDIDYVSLQYYKSNLPKNSALVCCDAASAFAVKFDFIVSNPPYLSDHDKKNKDHAIDGGPTGIESTLHFIRSAVLVLQKRGKMLTIISSLSDSSKLDKLIKEMNLKKRIVKIRKLFFETLYIIEISFDIA